MRVFFAVGLIVALELTAPMQDARAQHMNAAGAPCQEPASTAETLRCFVKAAKQADEKLNKTLGEIETFFALQHRSHDQEALRRAQSLWIRFRETNCGAARDVYGNGTGGPVNYWACMESQTRQRASDLRTGYGSLLEKFGRQL
jgi:uncharacterized protein YecT (DUF1311 family)